MRKMLVIGLVLTLACGCAKLSKKLSARGRSGAAVEAKATPVPTPPPPPGGAEQPAVHAPTGIVINPGGGGGSGGAVQAVRRAVTRTVNQNELENIRLFIDTASLASGRLPDAQEVAAALRKEAPKTYKLVQEGAIVLTGARNRESVWAYTADPQTAGGEHLTVTASGIERMAAPVLRQRLQQQQQGR